MSIPFMQLYVADYLSDTQHLTIEQSGCYMHLLMTMWRSGGALQNDQVKLARIVRLPLSKWLRISPDIMAFFEVSENEITQKRLTSEIKKAEKKSQLRAQVGKRGGLSKSLKNKEQALAIATVLLKHSSEPDNISSTEDKSSSEDTSFSLRSNDAREKSNFPKSAFEIWYGGYPHKIGKEAARKAFEKIQLAGKTTFAELCEGLERYKRSKPPDRLWCNPATWLNQGRWADQPSVDDGVIARSHSPPRSASTNGFAKVFRELTETQNEKQPDFSTTAGFDDPAKIIDLAAESKAVEGAYRWS